MSTFFFGSKSINTLLCSQGPGQRGSVHFGQKSGKVAGEEGPSGVPGMVQWKQVEAEEEQISAGILIEAAAVCWNNQEERLRVCAQVVFVIYIFLCLVFNIKLILS